MTCRDPYEEAFSREAQDHAEQMAPAWGAVFEKALEIGRERKHNPHLYRSSRFSIIWDPARKNQEKTLFYLLDTETAKRVAWADSRDLMLRFRAELLSPGTGDDVTGYRHPVYRDTLRGRLAWWWWVLVKGVGRA